MTFAQEFRNVIVELLDLVTQHEAPSIISEGNRHELRRLDASVVDLHALMAGAAVEAIIKGGSRDEEQQR
jgi:hypothetical protein